MFLSRKGGLTYVARTDVATYDIDQTTLTLDSAYHAWSLAAIVPASAKVVKVRVRAANAATGKHFVLVPHGYVQGFVKMDSSIIVVNLAHEQTGDVPCSGQVIDYKGDNVAWVAIGVTVLGWWL